MNTKGDRGWLLTRAARATGSTLLQDYRATPRDAKRRWLVTLAAGFAASVGVVVAVTAAARANGAWLRDRDEAALRLIERGPVSFSNAILLESFGNLAYMVPLTLAATVVAVRGRRPLLALSFPVAYLLQRPLVLTGWWMWNRERPRIIAGGVAAPELHSFPSGHVALVVAVYGLLAYLWARSSRSRTERVAAAVLLAALGVTVGWARLRLGAHWPSDVVAGIVIGAVWLISVVTALRRAEAAGGR